MTKREMAKFEKLLLTEGERLRRGIKQLGEGTLYQPAGDQTADILSYAEVGTDNFERETALSIASSESTMLREISEALERIRGGDYGNCEPCGKEIPKKRLEVFPAARYCVECQAKLEKNRKF
jgi:DnaK suppressor protein